MLMPKQRELHEFVDAYIRENGWGPTFDEIRAELHLKSKGQVYWLLNQLEERGVLRRIKGSPRAMSILRYADVAHDSDGNRYRRVPFGGI